MRKPWTEARLRRGAHVGDRIDSGALQKNQKALCRDVRVTDGEEGVRRHVCFTFSAARAGQLAHMAARWFSTVYYNAPMPHAIFFRGGYAIHGSYDIARLGGPASHDCIRQHPSGAVALFGIVQRERMQNTTIVVH
jgi:lipoprotein-anchoring transpeptidase ErfK/SrfK